MTGSPSSQAAPGQNRTTRARRGSGSAAVAASHSSPLTYRTGPPPWLNTNCFEKPIPHGVNVLGAEREPWLAIDPKPLVGERAFDAASLLRDRREELIQDPAAGPRIHRRLDQLTAELGLDRDVSVAGELCTRWHGASGR